MEVDITDKGLKYLDKLGSKAFEWTDTGNQIYDFTVLEVLNQTGSDSIENLLLRAEDYSSKEVEPTRASIRRLFEAGHIEIVN